MNLNKIIKIILINIFLFNNFIISSFAEDKILTEAEKVAEYQNVLTINALLPGYGQITQKKELEGYAYMTTSLTMLISGQALLLSYFYDRGLLEIAPYKKDDKNYLIRFTNPAKEDRNLLLYSGLFLSLYGTLLATYSSYSYHRDYLDANFTNNVKKGKESLTDLVFAPFVPENVFNFDVFPMYPIITVSSIQPSDLGKMNDFWKKDKVPFMGLNVAPWQGLLLEIISASLLVLANATWEEINFRGILLEKSGLTYSSITFGLAHAPNVLYPGVSVEETTLQTLFASLFGFYAGVKTQQNNYDFKKMIALHFWHNVTSASLNYMVNPDKGLLFINMSYKF